MMKFAITVLGAPGSSQTTESALQFIAAALAKGHEIYRVFFYQDGVHNASTLLQPPQDEEALLAHWVALSEEHGIDLVVCIAAALRRGIVDATEAERYEKAHHNLHPAFTLSGLGQLVEASIVADRVITFGHQ